MRGRRGSLLAVVVALGLGVSACSGGGDTVADQARDGDQKGYISGDGTVETLPPEDRTMSIELSGTTLEGEAWDSAEVAGDVLVINVWGSWCPPCEAEMPDLRATHAHFEETGEPVSFVGLNDRDSVSAALAFETRHEITYPSLADDGGQTLLQLQGMGNARPSTLILDDEGRLAARVLGPVDESTLRGLVEDVLEQ